jgi:hypothetical protein
LIWALKKIAFGSHLLPERLLPKPFGPYGPPGAAWGPFYGGLRNEFGPIEDYAVRLFQSQSGNLEVDGKAGIETLHRLDEIVCYLEQLPDIPAEAVEE